MADVHSPDVRSHNMSRIRSKDTKPEMIVRRFIFSKGLRFRLHNKSLPGKPDIVLKKFNTVILVHGCFWHGHEGCRDFKFPKENSEFWTKKLTGNKFNDLKKRAMLENLGWRVLVVYECELKPKKREKTLNELLNKLTSEYTGN